MAGRRPSNAVALGDWSDLYNEFLASERGVEVMEGTSGQLLTARGPTFELSMADLSGTSAPAANRASQPGVGAGPTSGASAFIAEVVADELVDEAEAVEAELLRRLGDEPPAPSSVPNTGWPPQRYAALQQPGQAGRMSAGLRSSGPAPLPPNLARPQPFSTPTAVGVPGSLAVSRQAWQAPASVPTKGQAGIGAGYHVPSSQRDSVLRASVPAAAYGAATGIPQGWVPGYGYGHGDAASSGMVPEPTTALRQAMGMRNIPVRTSAPAPLGGRPGARRDVSPGSMSRPSRAQPSSYAALHTQRQNSPPHSRGIGITVGNSAGGTVGGGGGGGVVGPGVGSSVDREEMFEALHRGLSPHRLRALYLPPGTDGAAGPGAFGRRESGPGGSYVTASAQQQQQQYPPYQNPLQRIENWAAAAAARSAVPQPAMYMTAAGPRASPLRQSAPIAGGDAASAQRGGEQYMTAAANAQASRGPQGQGVAGMDLRASAPSLVPRQAAAQAGGRAGSPTGVYRPPVPRPTPASAVAASAQALRATSPSWNEAPARRSLQHPASVSAAATAGSSTASTVTGNHRPSQPMRSPLPPQPYLHPHPQLLSAAGAGDGSSSGAMMPAGEPAAVGAAEPLLLEQLARRTPSPVEPRSPDLFISPQAYREYAAASTTRAGRQQQPGLQPATAPAVQVPSAGMTPVHGGEAAGLEAGGFTAHGIRGMQRRLAAGLEEAAAERDRDGQGAARRSPGRERDFASAAFTGAAASPVATLRPPDIYDDGVMQPRTASPYISTASNDMSAALEGGASPYTLAAAAAAAALAAAQRSDAMAARQRTRSSGGGAVGSGSLFESPSFGGTGLVPAAPAFGGVAASAGVAPVSLVAKGVADLDAAGLEALDAEFEFYEAITASRQGTQGGFASLPGAAAAAAAATPGGGVGTRAARAGARAFGGAGGAGAVRASWPSPTHQSPGTASALPSGAAAAAAAANGVGGRSVVASSVSSATWRAHGAGAPTTAAPLQGAVGARGSTSAGGSSAVAGGVAPGNAAPGVSGMSAAALSAAAAAVVATALQHTRSSSMSDNGGGVGGSALTPGPSAVLDTAALTAQLSRLDAASLEAIRGYASGYIDGRVQAMPQYGQVRSQVVKAAVLRLVDEALAARHAGDPSSQPQSQPLQVAADASRHVVAPRTGANPIKPASAGAALTFLPTTVPVPADRASPGEERLPAVDLDLDQAARCLPRHSPSDGLSAPVPPRPAPAYMSSSTRAGVAATLLPGNASETGSSVDSSPLHGSGGRRASGSRGISSPKSSALVTEASRSSGGRRKRVSWHSNFDGPPGTLPSSAGADGADAAAAAATGSGASAVDLIAAAAAAAVAAERASLEEAGMLTRAADAPPASDVVATGLGQAAATTPGAAAPAAGVVATAVSTMESRFQVSDEVQHDVSEHSPFSVAKGQPAFEYDDDQPRAPGPRPEPPQRRLSLAERIAAQLSDETPVAEGSTPPIGTDAAGQVNEPVSTAGADTAGADAAAESGSVATDGTQQETGALASAAAVMARAQLHDALAQRQRPDVAAATVIAAVTSMTSSEEGHAHGVPVGANVPTIAARPVAVAADEAAATASDGAVIIPTLLDAPREMVAVSESPIAVAAASSINGSPAPEASPATACAPPLRAETVGAGDGEPALAAMQHPEQSCAVGAVDGEHVKDLAADATTVAATAAAAAAASASAEAFAAGSAADAIPVAASSAYKEATAVPASQQQAPSANSISDGPGRAAAGHHRPLATSSSADDCLTRSPGSTGDGSDPGATPGLPARASTSSGSGAAPGTASVSVSVPVPMPGTAKTNARTGPHTPSVTGLNVGGGVSARKLGASPPGYQPQTHMQSSGGVTSPGVRMSTSSPTTAASNANTLGAATARGGATAGGASGGGIVLSRPAGPTFTSPPQSPASMRPSKLQALSSGFSARAVQSSGGAAPRHAAPGAGNTSVSSLSSGGAGPHPYQPTSPAPQHSISNKIMSIVSPTASGSGHHPVRSASRGGRDVGQATSAITGATGAVLSEQLRHDSLKFVRQLEAAIAEQAAEAGQSEAQSAQAAIRGAELEEQAEEQALRADAVQAPVAAQQKAPAVISPAEAAVELPEVQAVGNAVHAAPKREEQGILSATAESVTGTALVQSAFPEAAASGKAPEQKQGLAASVEAPQAIVSSSAAATPAEVPSAAEKGKMGLEALHTPHGEPPAAVATGAHVEATAVAAAAPFAADAAVQAAAGAVTTEQASAMTEHVRSEAATTAPAAAVEVSKAPAPPPAAAAEPAAARTTEVAVASAPASVPGSSRSADAAPSVAPAAQAPEKGHAEAAEPSKPEPEVPVAPSATAAPAVAAAAPTSPAVAPVQQPGPQPGGAGGTTSAAQGSPGASSPARGGAPRGVTLTHWRGSAGGGSPTKTASSAAAAVGASSDAAGPPAPEVSSLSALAAPAAAASATTLPPTAPLVPETAAAAAVTSSEQLKPTAVDKEVEPVTPPAPTPAEAPKPGAVGALPGLQAAVQAERQSAKGALPEPPAALQEVELPAGAAIGPTQPTALTVVSPGPAAPTVTAAPAELVRDTATSAQPAAAAPTGPTPSAAENVAAGAQPAPAASVQVADGGAPMAPAGEGASASAAGTTEAPATDEAPVAGGHRLKLSPSLNSVVSAADTPDGSGTTTPTQRRSGRDARSIEPVLAELKTVKSAIAAGDPDGSSTARMTELLEQLDSYRRGVERKHGPSHSIATQLRILHADMSKWLRSNTANTAAVPGAAGPGAAGSAHTNAGSGVVAAAAAAHGAVRTGSAGGSSTAARGAPPALEAVPEAAAAEQRPLPAQQAQLDQPGQQWAGAGSVGRRESQSSVNTDATFDTAGGGTAASTPRDSIADGGGGFSFPSHHASSEQPRGSAGGFNALPQPGRPSGSGLAGMQQPGNNGGAVNRGMGGVGGTATGNMGGMGTGGMPLSAGPGHQGMGSHVSFAAMGMAGAGAMGQGGTGIGAGGMGMGPGGSTGIGMGLYGAGGGMAQPGVGGTGHMGMAGAGMMQPGMHGTHGVGMAGMMQPGAGMMQPGAAGGGMGGGMSLMELANQLNSMTMQQQASHGPTQSAVFMPAGMRATMPSRTSEISAAAAATAVTAVQRTASASAQAEALQQSQSQKKPKSKWSTLFGKK